METTLILAYIGIALMVSMTAFGSVLGLTICGKTVVGAMKKDPTKMGQYIGLSALPSSQGLYGFIGWYFANQLVNPEMTYQVAIAILLCGLTLGICGLYSAIRQGQVLAQGIAATADGHNVTAATMVMAVFPELYAILGLLVALLTFLSFM